MPLVSLMIWVRCGRQDQEHFNLLCDCLEAHGQPLTGLCPPTHGNVARRIDTAQEI